ncbi:MAG: hypothetical protein ACLR8M_07450 [Oscillospiraceae bacterium]
MAFEQKNIANPIQSVGAKRAITDKIKTETAKGKKGGEKHRCEELCWI